MSLRLGIVGVGGLGALMARAARAALGVEPVACAASQIANAERFAAAHGIPRAHRDLEALVADDGVDAVCLGTPNGLHASQTLVALAAGKHVLVEKPMALSVADAVAMRERAEALGLVLGVGFHLRHHDVLRELKGRIDAGDVGRPILVRASWGMAIADTLPPWKSDPRMAGGGAWMGLGVHVLDLLRWLLGREPSRVVAASDARGEALDRTFLAAIELGDCLADVQVSRRVGLHPNGLMIQGEEGELRALDALAMGGEGVLVGGDGWPLMHGRNDPYRVQLEAFAAAVRGEQAFHADGADGVRSVELTQAIIAAAGAPR
jgi:1,5-anhydro-D-fructose reductase (1,5-anhydro-D-mannitol-forming)